ncbi:MAG: DUF4010 domain-containing protein [Planctomycetota bacterium]|nr:MAG: DUF4010 domain-containing protein [Planctomycetota bacterium]
MDIPPVFQTLGIALGLGLLVGLQRERSAKPIAGIRTFALVTGSGALSAMLAGLYGPWVLAASVVALGAVLGVGMAAEARRSRTPTGATTEIAALAMFLIGAYLVEGQRGVGVAMGAGVAVLLHAKAPLHRFVRGLDEQDVRALMRFALITLVILPVLPDEGRGPYGVLNPFNIWLMVVLVSGIGFAGYALFKIVGPRAGVIAAGLVGGAISSTATTASFAQRVAGSADRARLAAAAILLAGVVSIVRVLVEIAAVAPGFLRVAWWPIASVGAANALAALVVWTRARGVAGATVEPDNPVELKPALIFGALYALVLLAVAAAEDLVGAAGLYAVAVLSGLTDMDAVTLSTARLVSEGAGGVSAATGWRLILVALASNMAFKAGLAASLGGWRLGWRLAWPFGALIALILALALFV